jgi:hypothetical protein
VSSRVKALLLLLLWCHKFLVKWVSIVSLNLAPMLVRLECFRNRSVEILFHFFPFLIFPFLQLPFSCSVLPLLIFFCVMLCAQCYMLLFDALCSTLHAKSIILSEIKFSVLLIRMQHLSDVAVCNVLRPFFWLAPFAVTATPQVSSKTSGLLVRFSTDWSQGGGVETRVECAPGWTWILSGLKW